MTVEGPLGPDVEEPRGQKEVNFLIGSRTSASLSPTLTSFIHHDLARPASRRHPGDDRGLGEGQGKRAAAKGDTLNSTNVERGPAEPDGRFEGGLGDGAEIRSTSTPTRRGQKSEPGCKEKQGSRAKKCDGCSSTGRKHHIG